MDPELAKAMAKLAGFIHEHLPGYRVQVYKEDWKVVVKVSCPPHDEFSTHRKWWLSPQVLLQSALEPEDFARHMVSEVRNQDRQRMPVILYARHNRDSWGSDKSANDIVGGHRD